MQEGEEPDWEEQINNKTVSEQGFHLINSIHIAMVNVFMTELKNKEEKSKSSADAANKDKEEEGDTLMDDIRQHIEKPELVWPELIRLILKSQKNFDFYPLEEHIDKICDKLSLCTPESYSSVLSYLEKT